MRIGKQMAAVVAYVEQNPGRPMRCAAVFVGPSQRYGYATVHRAIKAGVVRTEPGTGNRVLLYPPEGK